MPKKGHTCCVLGCTVNSKRTQLPEDRRPRFFCFPHEKKRPHLRRAWLALTRRTEASTNTRVCEFHFVDGKPSSINPHPILNMGMEATKMQKRAMELRQQKALRNMIMQQQMASQMMLGHQGYSGQQVDGTETMSGQEMGLSMIAGIKSQQKECVYQEQGGLQPVYNPYEDLKMEKEEHDLPSQIGYENPASLISHSRSPQDTEAMQTKGESPEEQPADMSVKAEYQAHASPAQQPNAEILPEDCSKMIPQNSLENQTPASEEPPATATITDAKVTDDPDTVQNTKGFIMNLSQNKNGQINSILQGIDSSQMGNGHLPQMENKNILPSGGITPLKVPSWQPSVNGNANATPPSAPVAKKRRKRKSTPHMISSAKNTDSVPGVTISSTQPPQPKSLNPSNILMSMITVESLKSDILENLRAEFLTELQQESESNKQLKVEMESIRIQTRQELQQMRVELHALWGENQRLRAQVETLLQEKEIKSLNNE